MPVRVAKCFATLLLVAARAHGVCPLSLRKNFLKLKGAARARVGFAFVLVSCGNVARTQVAALAHVGFASVHDDVSEIGHLVQLAA